MTKRDPTLWTGVISAAVFALCMAVCLGAFWGALSYGPVLVHGLRTGDLDLAARPDRAQPRFIQLARATGCEPWQVLPSGRCSSRTRFAECNTVRCNIAFDRGWIIAVDYPVGDTAAAPPFTGHFPQRLGYRIGNGGETYDMTVAVAYRPSAGEDRLGDDVDTTESWEHLDAGINFVPVAGRMQWTTDGREARLLVRAYDGAQVVVNIRQPLAEDAVECSRGVVLFGPNVRRAVLVDSVKRCLNWTPS